MITAAWCFHRTYRQGHPPSYISLTLLSSLTSLPSVHRSSMNHFTFLIRLTCLNHLAFLTRLIYFIHLTFLIRFTFLTYLNHSPYLPQLASLSSLTLTSLVLVVFLTPLASLIRPHFASLSSPLTLLSASNPCGNLSCCICIFLLLPFHSLFICLCLSLPLSPPPFHPFPLHPFLSTTPSTSLPPLFPLQFSLSFQMQIYTTLRNISPTPSTRRVE